MQISAKDQNLTRNHAERAPALLPVRKEMFLKAYADCGVVTVACMRAGISRSSYYEWRQEDEAFDIGCDDAKDASIDLAEHELRNRGVHGVEEPVLFKGEPIWRRDPVTGEILLDDDFDPIPFTINRKSDKLLEVYMKAHRQEYRDKGSLEVTGKNGGAIEAQFEVTYVLPADKTEEDYKVIEHQHAGQLSNNERALAYEQQSTNSGEDETDYS